MLSATAVAEARQPLVAPVPAIARPASATLPGTVPSAMQYLHGSGEAAAISVQAWHGLVAFNTNRSASNAAFTAATLDRLGLGPAIHKRTLWLQGDDNTGPLKDVRRWSVADSYCVIAMAGDQLGDFSDLFFGPVGAKPLSIAERRAATLAPAVERLWGAGWFVTPNPVYGTAAQGGMDAVVPPATRWVPR